MFWGCFGSHLGGKVGLYCYGFYGLAPRGNFVSPANRPPGIVLISRLLSAVQAPPPWLWCAEDCFWQRLGSPRGTRFPLEVAQQFHWWFIRPFRARDVRPFGPLLPWTLRFRACWLNSFQPREVAWWRAVGVCTWAELAHQRPDSLAWTVHARRRLAWPGQCQDALRLLRDKGALLALTPEPWRAPWMVLDPAPPPSPAWWERALSGAGVVLKPLHGHGGRAVIRFRCTASGLEAQPLFCRLPAAPPDSVIAARPTPTQLVAHWQRLCRTEEAALAAPYLAHSGTLPASEPSVVVRLITARDSPAAPVEVRLAWLEVPLGEGAVAFVHLQGHSLPPSGPPLSPTQGEALRRWQALLRAGPPACVEACLTAAREVHALLPPIDQVAWDWIPADPEPLLLEGNGCFGLLVPQLFEWHGLDPLRIP